MPGEATLAAASARYIVASHKSTPRRTYAEFARSVELKVDLGQARRAQCALSRIAYRDLARYDLFPERAYSRPFVCSLPSSLAYEYARPF